MHTRPISTPHKGMIVFSEARGLMAKITSINDSGFRFHVMNGMWDGHVENSKIIIKSADQPGATDEDVELGENSFREVLSVTRNEYEQWYMGDHPRSCVHLIDRVVDDAAEPPLPDPEVSKADTLRDIDNLIADQGWNEGSVERLALEFISGRGLEKAFLEHLLDHANAENSGFDDMEEEPVF